MTTFATPRRRWFRYSLRTLFVLVLFACTGMSWLAMKMRQAKREQAAVKAIEELGETVRCRNSLRELGCDWLQDMVGVDFVARADYVEIRTDAATAYLSELTHLSSVDLVGPRVTSAGVHQLCGLNQLECLSFKEVDVTDADLKCLGRFTELQVLFIEPAHLTLNGLEHLKGLTHLRMLSLTGTQVTDASIEQLKGMTQLKVLVLADPHVTDAGLKQVKLLPQLEELDITGTHVSDGCVRELRRLLPTCRISH